LHNGRNNHIHDNFVYTTNEFAPMHALHLILYQLAKHNVPCHEQSCRTDSYLIDGHLVCANHCISKCPFCLLVLHVYHPDDILEYFDCAMTYSMSNYKSFHVYHCHGDAVYDPRTDLSQGGRG
jgi:hypothetical protein